MPVSNIASYVSDTLTVFASESQPRMVGALRHICNVSELPGSISRTEAAYWNQDGFKAEEYEETECIELSDLTLLLLKFDKNALLDFSKFTFNQNEVRCSEEFRLLVDKYKKYPIMTLGEYRITKNYPSGKDFRPDFFNPNDINLAAHGTNFEVLLCAVINCNLQISPSLKVFKLQGAQSMTGENARHGGNYLNCRGVSTVFIRTTRSNFDYVKEYAVNSTSDFLKGPKNNFNIIPVVIIGEGVIDYSSFRSSVPNEAIYKRLNIRIIAFQNKEDKDVGVRLLRKAHDEMGLTKIASLKVCTFFEMDSVVFPECEIRYPAIDTLWENSEVVVPK